MASYLTKEQKDALGPLFVGLLVGVVSLAAGVAVYHMSGGSPIPVVSTLTPWILGAVVTLIVHKQLSK